MVVYTMVQELEHWESGDLSPIIDFFLSLNPEPAGLSDLYETLTKNSPTTIDSLKIKEQLENYGVLDSSLNNEVYFLDTTV